MVLAESMCCGLMPNLLLRVLICNGCVFNFLQDASRLDDDYFWILSNINSSRNGDMYKLQKQCFMHMKTCFNVGLNDNLQNQ